MILKTASGKLVQIHSKQNGQEMPSDDWAAFDKRTADAMKEID